MRMQDTIQRKTKNSTFRILEKADFTRGEGVADQFARDIFIGLLKTPKELSSKYFYDEIGSKIYEEIMELPEYYLVESECEILETYSKEIGKFFQGESFNLIELGAGNGEKTTVLLKDFLKLGLNFSFIPVDISYGAMEDLINKLNKELPDLRTEGLVAEYFDALKWIAKNQKQKKNIVLFLGSNIGNFKYSEAKEFLFSLWRSLNPDDLVLIGFDLRKDIEIMSKAYNDSKGVTKRFNMNLLERINRELGGEFDLSKFRHYEPYNVYSGAMESYIFSLEEQDVFIKKLAKTFHFGKFEPIFVEQSYKYLNEDIERLAKITGYKILANYYDSKKYFVDSLWQVEKTPE